MESVDLGLVCPCGHENFERVVAERRPGSPVVTGFVACVAQSRQPHSSHDEGAIQHSHDVLEGHGGEFNVAACDP